MLIAGAVLAFVLPALPFIRFLFGVFGWLVNVVEAVLAVTVFAAAHVTRGQDRGLMVPATRQGWLFLPGLILRPPLMLFGLILGYFVFLAAIGLLNAIWLPQLRDAGASDGLGPIGFLAMLTLYVMLCYALMNGAFKLIDLLPRRSWSGSADAPAARTTARGASRAPSPAASRAPAAGGSRAACAAEAGDRELGSCAPDGRYGSPEPIGPGDRLDREVPGHRSNMEYANVVDAQDDCGAGEGRQAPPLHPHSPVAAAAAGTMPGAALRPETGPHAKRREPS